MSPCLFAGLIYAFSSAKLFYAALGQYNIASSQWIPFCVLYILRIGRATSLRHALRNASLAALFLILQAWAELTYASFLFIFIAIYICYVLLARLRSQLTGRNLLFTLCPFFLLGLLFLLGLAPFLWAMLPDLRNEGDFFTSGGGFSDVFSADLAGYLVPTRLHPLLGQWVTHLPFPNDVGQQVYLGYSVVGIALIGAIMWLRNTKYEVRGARGEGRAQGAPASGEAPNTQSPIPNPGFFWLFNTLFFWWLTLGPHIRWLGRDLPIPGPFALISLLPFFNGNRYPSRYSGMLLLCVAVLAGYGIVGIRNWILSRWRNTQSLIPNTIFIILSLSFAAEHLSLPLPLNDFRVPEIYTKLAAEPGDFAILELPTGWRNGARVLGKSDKLIMMQEWYQTVHGKRRLGGNTSRNPPYKFQYFTNAPLISDLIALMNADPAAQPPDDALVRVVTPMIEKLIQQDRVIAPNVLALLNIRYVLLHVEKATPTLQRLVAEALPVTLLNQWHGVDWEGAASTIRLYAVQPHPPATDWAIDLASPVGNLYLAEGWSTVTAPGETLRYATRSQPLLFLPPMLAGGQLTLTLASNDQLAGASLNNIPLIGTQTHAGGETTVFQFTIPSQVAEANLNRLQLQFKELPRHVTELRTPPDPHGWPIGQTGTFLPTNTTLVVQSAGKDVGDFAHIYLNGQEVARQQRGYNLVALDQQGQVLDRVSFDTLASATASADLATWLQRWPAGVIIAGAVMDEASLRLGPEAVTALKQIGVVTDLRDHFRWSHAFIGVVGAVPGTALEQATLLQPATLFIGAPVDGAAVYGGIATVRYHAAP